MPGVTPTSLLHDSKIPDDVYKRILETEQNLEDGDITHKGFLKTKAILLKDYMSVEDQETVDRLESRFRQKICEEHEYVGGLKRTLGKYTNQDEYNKLDCDNGVDVAKNGRSCENLEEKLPVNTKSIKRKASAVESSNGVTLSPKVQKKIVDEENEASESVKSDSDFENKENGSGNVHNGKTASSCQLDIKSMFKRMEKISKENTDKTKQPSKKLKVDSDCATSCGEETVPSCKTTSSIIQATRCVDCRQLLQDNSIRMFLGDPADALEELEFIFDERLLLEDERPDALNDEDTRPQHKITNFTVYCKSEHICPFDSGLIEKDKELYFSGYVKPVFDDDPSCNGGVPGKRIGPIIEWWCAGFDGGQEALVGFSTQFAHYFLMSPSKEYETIIQSVRQKVYMNKIVIECLTDNPYATYEDLLYKLEVVVPPSGMELLDEDLLQKHAQFIVDQVASYDIQADEDEPSLIGTPCMRALVNLTGVKLGRTIKSKKREKVEKIKRPPTKATTTPLVHGICEEYFKDEMDTSNIKATAARRRRCGVCEVCQQPDCGECTSCKNMVKFGGSGKSKQACLKRRCPYKEIEDAEYDDIGSDDDIPELNKKEIPFSPKKKIIQPVKNKKVAVEWKGESTSQDSRKFYNSVMINNELIEVDDHVLVMSDSENQYDVVGQILYMWESKSGSKMSHVQWYCRGTETVLGAMSDPQEVFVITVCDDINLNTIISKCDVRRKVADEGWYLKGGVEDDSESLPNDGKTFFCQKMYSTDTARFEDLPTPEENVLIELDSCFNCQQLESLRQKDLPTAGNKLEETEDKIFYGHVMHEGTTFKVGDCVYINHEAYKIGGNLFNSKRKSQKEDFDDEKYPEYYRKTSDYIKGSNQTAPPTFRIGRIKEIFTSNSSSFMSKHEVRIRINKFFRPENTCKSKDDCYASDLNLLYWTDLETVVDWKYVEGKTYVVYKGNLISSVDDYTDGGTNRFYFSEAYDTEEKIFEEPPTAARLMGGIGKGKGKGKGTKCKQSQSTNQHSNGDMDSYLKPQRLRTLDVFAGCGGLSEGLHRANVAESCWAVELDDSAAKAFKLNNPNAEVFTEDCNHILRLVIEGSKTNSKGQALPQKGDVDLLCGGPPCQGFSGMNRFNTREYSKFKNSLIVSYLSYCDYYRPKFFILENVRNFFSYKENMVHKLALRCLLKMGYQVTFGVLQAGQYGVAQTRRRAIILAAAPGEVLPVFPEPTHVFSPRACILSVTIGDEKLVPTMKWLSSAPYRTITVRDCMSDLPEIKNGARDDPIPYGGDPQTHFQRLMRGGKNEVSIVHDHVVKEMKSLVETRIKHIPLTAGSDWRDLPNIAVKLSDGTYCNKLIYTHEDKKNGESSNGSLRGVCACASVSSNKNSKYCDPIHKQDNTLIPWCLPHTGNRHNHWAGLYGRLEYDGFFSTTVTNPEPMGKQGRVLHPEQHRVVSVRECARSQGFRDSFRFYGNILDRHRQIGNAVPPPLATAIGREILKSIHAKEKLLRNDEKEIIEEKIKEPERKIAVVSPRKPGTSSSI